MFGYRTEIQTDSGNFPFNPELQRLDYLQGSIRVETTPPAEGDRAEFGGKSYLILEVFPGPRVATGLMSNQINKRYYLSAAPVSAHAQGAFITGTVPVHVSEHQQIIEADAAGSIVAHESSALIRKKDCTHRPKTGDTIAIDWHTPGTNQAQNAKVTAVVICEHPAYHQLRLQIQP